MYKNEKERLAYQMRYYTVAMPNNKKLKISDLQDSNYAQHSLDSPDDFNPNNNPVRDAMIADINRLSKEDLVRLSRASYLQHAQRFNVGTDLLKKTLAEI